MRFHFIWEDGKGVKHHDDGDYADADEFRTTFYSTHPVAVLLKVKRLCKHVGPRGGKCPRRAFAAGDWCLKHHPTISRSR